jgi:Uma2 family endonuclease
MAGRLLQKHTVEVARTGGPRSFARVTAVPPVFAYDGGMATTTLMSFAEFERLEQGADQIELLNGELIRVPPPYLVHMQICERLYKILDSAVERLRKANPDLNLGSVHIEMGYYFRGTPTSWLRPDVSVTHPDQAAERFYFGAPLIALEVVSEYDTAPRLNEKVAAYLANGSAEVWLIYPKQRHAWVYDGSAAARKETESIHTALLPGIDIPLADIL